MTLHESQPQSEPFYRRVMSGAERGAAAATLRAGLRLVEPFYAAVASARNRGYERRPGRARRLPRPVLSVGNITAGGTGKTPVVRWLAQRLRQQGRNVAILSRGYKAAPGTLGDEQRMLDDLLNRGGRTPTGAAGGAAGGAADEAAGEPGGPLRPVRLFADPDRFAAGERALREHPEIDVILLDDGFQHRRLARDLDLVLIRATEPFGYGHVLPRGLLREPLAGLRRADAFVLTHADGVTPEERARIEQELRRHNPSAPIYAAVHAPVALREAHRPRASAVHDAGHAAGVEARELPLERLAATRAFAFCGIGNPSGFEREMRRLCGQYAGHRWFADHHAYTAADLRAVRAAAARAGAEVLVTTEKDWVKLATLAEGGVGRERDGAAAPAPGPDLPVWRLDVAARFLGDDERRLLDQVGAVLAEGKRGNG